jgi:glycosyltransferase involved in cell wall biosynthesis
MDYHFGFTDITTALAADRVLFNSHTHRKAFLHGLAPFLRKLPEHRPLWAVEEIRRKSDVLYPGCDFGGAGSGAEAGLATDAAPAAAPANAVAAEPGADKDQPPLIVWNHRWEFDKDPDAFFAAVDAAAARGHRFRLALLGENFQTVPQAFEEARRRHGARIVRYGWEPTRRAYLSWLRRGDIVVSTAIQENFGISVVEAIRSGCYPLLPRRLSYPELLPQEYHSRCLYEGRDELINRLCALVGDPRGGWRSEAAALSRHMERFSWRNMIGRYDEELGRLAGLSEN